MPKGMRGMADAEKNSSLGELNMKPTIVLLIIAIFVAGCGGSGEGQWVGPEGDAAATEPLACEDGADLILIGHVDMAYSKVPAVATGGSGEYEFTLADGDDLPEGLSLSLDGEISGTPTEKGKRTVALTVTDSDGNEAECGPYSINIWRSLIPEHLRDGYDASDWDLLPAS